MNTAQWVAGVGGGQETRLDVTGQLKLRSPSQYMPGTLSHALLLSTEHN